MIKIGVPKKPVTADKGISDAVKLREIISHSIANIAPNNIVKGIVFRASLPTKSRDKCGITKPIQPTIPLYATEDAVNKVAIKIIKLRYTV